MAKDTRRGSGSATATLTDEERDWLDSDLDTESLDVWQRRTRKLCYRLAEARSLMQAARKNHVCNCPDCAAIDEFLGESQ